LNTPVVVVEDLPAGPATAVIACLAGPGGARISLAIRSERSGQVVFFGPDDELREWQGQDLALEAALSFAESMGFLFEDDRLAASPAEARGLWEALLDASGHRTPPAARGAPAPTGERAAAPQPADETGAEEELWLEDVAAPAPLAPRSLLLTKFRRAVSAAPAPGTAPVPGERQPPARIRVGSPRRSA
jgi:hypothetical protein